MIKKYFNYIDKAPMDDANRNFFHRKKTMKERKKRFLKSEFRKNFYERIIFRSFSRLLVKSKIVNNEKIFFI